MGDYRFTCCGAQECRACGSHPVVAQLPGRDYAVWCGHCNPDAPADSVPARASTRDEAISIWNTAQETPA